MGKGGNMSQLSCLRAQTLLPATDGYRCGVGNTPSAAVEQGNDGDVTKGFCMKIIKSRMTGTLAAAAAVLVLAGCATPAGQPGGPKPVFYPNAKLNQVGQAQAQADSSACMDQAEAAGVNPEGQAQTSTGAARGAAVGATAAAVSGLLFGRNASDIAGGAARGAVVGGATGAVAGSFRGPNVNPLFRNFVDRCLRERGYEVIGWSSD